MTDDTTRAKVVEVIALPVDRSKLAGALPSGFDTDPDFQPDSASLSQLASELRAASVRGALQTAADERLMKAVSVSSASLREHQPPEAV